MFVLLLQLQLFIYFNFLVDYKSKMLHAARHEKLKHVKSKAVPNLPPLLRRRP